MEKRPNNGRKKTTGKGSATVQKKDEQVQVNGPVGREDGYAGKQEAQTAAKEAAHAAEQSAQAAARQAAQHAAQHGAQTNNANGDVNRAGGADLLGALLGGSSSGSSSNSSSSSGLGALGSLLGGSSSGSSSGSNQQQSSGGLLGGFGSTTGGSSGSNQQSSGGSSRSGGGLMKILLIIGVIIIGYFLLKSCMGGQACSVTDISGLGGDSVINSSGSSVSNGSSLQGYLSSAYDSTDSSAPIAAYSSTSGSSLGYASAPTSSSTSTTVPAADTTVSNKARAKRTVLKGNGQDVMTIMVFMCGTDLESKYGMATNDLNEMLHANIDLDHVNIIVETGGTKTWKNNVISNSTNQRYQVTSKGLKVLDNNLGKRQMTSPDTLSDFIKFCKANYPADRYALIFWDHGGGSLSGYGYDQYYSGSMTLDKINKALHDGGCVFDFIGFDACLMATMETAIVTEQYADYLIASEETEPGCGWYYTNWVTALSNNPSISTVELGKIIVDDFNDVCRKNNCGDSTTLSVTDLAEFAGTVPEAFSAFSSSVTQMLNSDEYQVVANARGVAKEFGADAGINHVDLIHLAKGIAGTNASGSDEAQALINALSGCIKYNRTSVAMKNSYGMSIYFPYTSFKSVNSAVSLYNAIGVDSRYSEAIKSFASMAAGGQIATGGSNSAASSLFGGLSGSSTSSSDMLSQLLGSYLGGGTSSSSGDSSDALSSILGGDYSSWFNGRMVLDHSDYYDAHALYNSDMLLTDKAGGKVLSLSDEKWAIVRDIQLNVFVDDGEGYIDLGMDNVFDYDADGDLLIDFDGTWLALDGHIVPYYMESSTDDGNVQVITGYVPARLNGTDLVHVMLVFEYDKAADKSNDYVAGARYIYENGETDTIGKGLIELKKGDKLEFICDYYGYDGSYNASYVLEDSLTLTHDMADIVVENLKVDNSRFMVTYCLTDIYDNQFWTESVEF